MASIAQMALGNRMLQTIKTEGAINKFDLMDRCGISVATYNQISGWFQHRFAEQEPKLVEYDKKSKNWKWIKNEEIIQVD